MATLQTIRNRGGLLVSIVIGLALIAFIVGDALNSGSRIFNSQRNQIGEIAGEGVSIIDFQNRVSKNEEMIKAMNNVRSEERRVGKECRRTADHVAGKHLAANDHGTIDAKRI